MVPDRATCPRRMTDPGPWEHREDLDGWRPGGQLPSGLADLRCSFCGSLDPDTFMTLVEDGAEVVPTDKPYKAYVRYRDVEVKFYYQHMPPAQVRRFVELHDSGRLNVGYPGHFYIRPFILVVTSAPPFSFGAIVTVERTVPDGQVITLVDPAYTYLIDAIKADPEIVHQIDPRKWEEIIAAAYDRAGFDEVILTPRSGDAGRDVIAIKRGLGSVKFIEQIKAYKPGHVVTADEVRSLLGVLQAEQNASKAVFTTTSSFAPRITSDKLIKPFIPYRLELIDKNGLLQRLSRLG